MESARSRNMTQGAGTCWQHADVDGSPPIWIEPARLSLLSHLSHPPSPPDPPPGPAVTERGRLSWASVALLLALLSDHLWFRAEATFMDNSSAPLCDRFEDGYEEEDAAAKSSLTFSDVEQLCGNISDRQRSGRGTWAVNVSSLYLAFCSSYSLLDLLRGSSRPDRLNCSLGALHDGPLDTCSACLSAFQRYDLHALEKYEEFETLALKYEPGPYSVRTCMDQCKMAYKWWLCAQFFPHTAPSCPQTVPCVQSCLQVQQSCPYILPDNEDLIHGGSPSFICTGLMSDDALDSEARCCDVRWDSPQSQTPPPRSQPPPASHGTLKRTASPSCQQGAPVSSSPRLRLCPLLVLALLHTALLISHNATLSDEGSSNED